MHVTWILYLSARQLYLNYNLLKAQNLVYDSRDVSCFEIYDSAILDSQPTLTSS